MNRERSFALASFVAYCAALALPALVFHTTIREVPSDVWTGVTAALVGWEGMLVLNFAWLANLAYFVSLRLLLLRRWRAAAAIASIGFLLALQTLSLVGRELPADEGGVNHMTLVRLHVGFYAWLASLLIVTLGAHASRRRSLQ